MPLRTTDCRLLFGEEHAREIFATCASLRHTAEGDSHGSLIFADCQWIAELLQHGLLRASYIPSVMIRDLRDLTRARTSLSQEHSRIASRIQKVLEDANIKLASVASNALGKSGRAMLEAIIGGEESPERLAELALGHLRLKIPQLQTALEGRVRDHHRFSSTEFAPPIAISGS